MSSSHPEPDLLDQPFDDSRSQVIGRGKNIFAFQGILNYFFVDIYPVEDREQPVVVVLQQIENMLRKIFLKLFKKVIHIKYGLIRIKSEVFGEVERQLPVNFFFRYLHISDDIYNLRHI